MNYYLTKSNPNVFRLQDFLATPLEGSRWTVCRDAKPGDILFIGLAGEEAGIYARATITAPPIHRGEDPDFWIDPKEAAKPRWRADIEFSINRVQSPILEQNLAAIPELKRIAKWLHLQGASCHLTEQEAQLLNRLIEERM